MATRGSTIQIVCATSLAGGEEAFETLGSVRMVPEAEITRQVIRDADVLVTRSKVKVNDSLLADSRLTFYGTATAGYDHVHVEALERRGITWSQAPGSNANSVVEYVLACLSSLGLQKNIGWKGKTIGIMGAGQVGSRLQKSAAALGLNVRLNDPPLHEQTGDAQYLSRDEVIQQSDVVSLHVPLTDEGLHATRAMVDSGFFSSMRNGAVFINASRGEVVNENDLVRAVHDQKFSGVVLDVFDHEPDINPDMLDAANLASPHIAGYSLDGRLKGTEMIYLAACKKLGIAPRWKIPPVAHPLTIQAPPPDTDERTLFRIILAAYDPREDDRRLREIPDGMSMGSHFQKLRKLYPERREFRHYAVEGVVSKPVAEALTKLGFIVQTPR